MPRLALSRYDDLEAFEDRAMPFLMEREAEHNLFLGICSQIRGGRYVDPYLATVEHGTEIVAAAWRTPPHNIGLSLIDDLDALPVIAEDARAAFDSLPGVIAAKEDARRFAEWWCELTGSRHDLHMEQRIYRATEVFEAGEVPGRMLDGTTHDRDLLISWVEAFNSEVGGIMTSAEEAVHHRLAEGGLVLWWDDGRPVSLAGFGGPTPNGIRVGPVYTPPELRGRGYASACVAALTRQLLDSGRRFVFLFTDLANPTSNLIYQKVGYRPVCDVDQYSFE